MKNSYEVYAVRLQNKKVFAVKTELPDIVSIDRMKSLISVDGLSFFIEFQGKKYYFTFDKDNISQPPENVLKKVPQF